MTRERNLAAALGGWSISHRKSAIFGWLMLVVLATLITSLVGQLKLTQAEQGAGDSARAEQILAEAGIERPAAEMVLVHGTGPDGFRSAAQAVTIGIKGTGQVQDVRAPLISQNRRDALIQFTMTGDAQTSADRVQPVLDAVAKAGKEHPEATISEVGDASGQKWFQQMVGTDFARAEWTAVPLALGILLVTFGALLAAVLPVALALTAFLISLGLLTAFSHLVHLDDSANSVMLLMGLAVGVDYCLFYIRRERAERAAGRDAQTALRIAAATSGRSVLISGMTVMVAMSGMLLSGMLLFTGFAMATIMVVCIAMVGSVTVLPALLSLLGDKVEFGRIPLPGRRGGSGSSGGRRSRRTGSRLWDALLRPVLAKPGLFAVLSAGVLLALAVPALGMHTEKLGIDRQLPSSNPLVKTYQAIGAAFPGGPAPAMVVLKAHDIQAPEVQRAISSFAEAAPGLRVTIHQAANIAELDVPLPGSGSDEVSKQALRTLRAKTIPSTLGRVGEAKVHGDLAFSTDFNDRLRSSIVPVFVFVMAITFLLMLVSFRSVVIAATSILLNLLSVAASYGAMVAVFQHGWGASLVGTQPAGALESWIPLFVFVVLFGLSMDYHVFVVSRIREAHDGGMPTTAAVSEGIRSTAGVVTSAAVIMIAVFSVFGTLSMQDFKQLGVGLAVAVFLDATVVRAVLLPSLMTLLGEWNWYLPRWLGALPLLSHSEPVRPVAKPQAAEPVRL